MGGNGHKTPPWSDIQNNLFDFISPEYLPVSLQIKDPSKMVMNDIDQLILHWQDRVENSLEILQFKAYKAKGGNMVYCRPPPSFDNLIPMPDEGGEQI